MSNFRKSSKNTQNTNVFSDMGLLLSVGLLGVSGYLWYQASKSPFERGQEFKTRTERSARSHEANINNFGHGVSEFEQAAKKLQKEGKPLEARRALLEIGKMYRQGVPDRYDRKGYKVKGVPRNLTKALEYFDEAWHLGNEEALLLKADTLYYDCIEDYAKPNAKEDAKEIYEFILNTTEAYAFSNDTRNTAMDRLQQMQEESQQSAFVMGTNTFGNAGAGTSLNVFGQFMNLGNTLPPVGPTPPPFQAQRDLATRERPGRVFVRRLAQHELDQAAAEREARLNRFDRNTIVMGRMGRPVNDPQNTHDHGVVNTVKESIKRLRTSTEIGINVPNSLTEIRGLINSSELDFSPQQREDASATLDRIETSQGVLSGTDETEVGVLNLVWNRIHNNLNQNHQSELRRNLIMELAEGVENGNVVCSRGRFNRIVDSLNKIDPEVEIKPKWVMQQEMLSKAAKIRKDQEETTFTTRTASN